MCKEKEDKFIGRTFPTPKGGILTVVIKLPRPRTEGSTLYEVECSVCSKDRELFPSLTSTKASLKRGSVPCGCSKRPLWSLAQDLVRVKRVCHEKGYSFLGFNGEYEGSKTRLILHNPLTDNTWNTATINTLVHGVGDPVAGIVKRSSSIRLPDHVHRDDFIAAGFSPYDKFTRRSSVTGKEIMWDFECHLCSTDMYVEDGVCTGLFKSTTSNLKQGIKPCRCGNGFKWTKEQKEVCIKKLCKQEGLTFGGWVGEYTGSASKFKWFCKFGHINPSTNSHNFIHKGSRCKSCGYLHREPCSGTGYYPERASENDYLYVMDIASVSSKVGRTFNIEDRRQGIKSKGGLCSKPEILQIYTATHQVVYDTEQAIHTELRERGFQYHCDWTWECFDNTCLPVLQELLDTYVESGILKRIK